MSKHLQLNIAEPCHENWDNMTPVQKGKFCGSCQKQVIDFSNMSDREVAQFFKKPSTGSVCGRFMQDQLERSIEIPRKRIPWVKYFFQFALPAFLMSTKATAQGKVKVTTTTNEASASNCTRLMGKIAPVKRTLVSDTLLKPVQRQDDPPIVLQGIIGLNNEAVSKSIFIKGKVVDEKGNPIPFASIIIKDTKDGAATDDKGTFSIKLKRGLNDLILMTSSVGFETKEINVKPGELNNLLIQLNANQMLGEVVVRSDISQRGRMGGLISCVSITGSRAMVTSLFRSDSVKIYPNPVLSGSMINIEVLKWGEGKTLIQLYNMAGQKVHVAEINMDSKSWKATLPLPSLMPGVYIIKVYSDEKKKTYTTKIVVG
jgi:CarboxypepD_reg-like domain/Secretion system C-terminal sorting domain